MFTLSLVKPISCVLLQTFQCFRCFSCWHINPFFHVQFAHVQGLLHFCIFFAIFLYTYLSALYLWIYFWCFWMLTFFWDCIIWIFQECPGPNIPFGPFLTFLFLLVTCDTLWIYSQWGLHFCHFFVKYQAFVQRLFQECWLRRGPNLLDLQAALLFANAHIAKNTFYEERVKPLHWNYQRRIW